MKKNICLFQSKMYTYPMKMLLKVKILTPFFESVSSLNVVKIPRLLSSLRLILIHRAIAAPFSQVSGVVMQASVWIPRSAH